MRRTPKRLTAEPATYVPAAGGLVRADRAGPPPGPGSRRGAPAAPGRARTTGGESGDGAAEEASEGAPDAGAAPARVADVALVPPDPEVRARARRIAARLAVPRARRDVGTRRGTGDLAAVPYRGGSDEIDLDRTLEVLGERPVPDDEDIIVRERLRTRRSVVLAVDVSGSMRGERVRTAAAAVGALAAELYRDDLAVIAFWSDAAVLLRLGGRFEPLALLDTLLRIPAKGLTNVEFPLRLAARELARVPARDARVVLLSDCVHNAGADPRRAAARLPRLDVLADVAGEQDLDLARDLADAGRGRLAQVRTYRDVPPALTAAFAG